MDRCVCESSVCTELVVRMTNVMKPQMLSAFKNLPPKMLEVVEGLEPQEVAIEGGDLAKRVEDIKSRVKRATFTSESDKIDMVQNLLEDGKAGRGEARGVQYLDIRDRDGQTALHISAAAGNTKVLTFLVYDTVNHTLPVSKSRCSPGFSGSAVQ